MTIGQTKKSYSKLFKVKKCPKNAQKIQKFQFKNT